jgi:hypothetical protein
MFTGGDGNAVIGFCLWCNGEFHSFREAEAHIYDGSGACHLFPEMSREPSVPPGLQILLEEAGLLNRLAKNVLTRQENS